MGSSTAELHCFGDGNLDSVERLMGTKAEARFAFIQEHAEFASEEILDV
jgi:topoisomerase-4 subunit B